MDCRWFLLCLTIVVIVWSKWTVAKSFYEAKDLLDRSRRDLADVEYFDTYRTEFDQPLLPNVVGVVPDENEFGPLVNRPGSQRNDQEPTEQNGKKGVPQFMLDLFERFDEDPSMQPTSNIIRSFPNKATKTQLLEFEASNPGCSAEHYPGSCVNKRLLLFNVSTIPMHELVTLAELRFYKSFESYRWPAMGVDVRIEIVEVECSKLKMSRNGDKSIEYCSVTNEGESHVTRRVLDSRLTSVRRGGWETFDVTGIVRSWAHRHSSHRLHQVEVQITVMDREYGTVDVDINAPPTREPLLIVFSDDTSKHRHLEKRKDMEEILSQQADFIALDSSEEGTTDNSLEVLNKRKRRSVSSKDIDIEIGGIKVPVKLKDPEDLSHKRNRSRSKRSTLSGPHCHLADMEVNFADIHYDFIQRPTRYRAFKCVGSCNIPLTSDTTKHAAIQAAMHLHFPMDHDPPCCVPTKLGPISVLYSTQEGVIEYKYEYQGMEVLECGCR